MSKKKIFLFNILIILILLISLLPTTVKAANDTTSLSINSPAVVLMERKSGKIIYQKNSDVTRYPASTTKIMTAIIALEKCNLNDKVKISNSTINNIPEGYTKANLKVGEEVTIEQLLNLLLIPSASDAANAIAEHISGTTKEFANLMNKKAAEIGCKKTHFLNPDGIHESGHTSTAYDLALIANYAMNNDTFRKIVSKATYTLYPTNLTTSERTYKNTNLLLDKHSFEYYYDKAIGIKTGYTTPAGDCLVAAGYNNDIECIVVILGAGENSKGLSERFLESKDLFEYAFNNYTFKNIQYKSDVITTIQVKNATFDTKNLNLESSEKINALINKEDLNTKFEPEITLNENIQAPILQGDKLGTAKYTIEGITYNLDLLASNDVYKSNLPIYIGAITIFIFVIILIIKFSSKKKNKKKKRKKK